MLIAISVVLLRYGSGMGGCRIGFGLHCGLAAHQYFLMPLIAPWICSIPFPVNISVRTSGYYRGFHAYSLVAHSVYSLTRSHVVCE